MIRDRGLRTLLRALPGAAAAVFLFVSAAWVQSQALGTARVEPRLVTGSTVQVAGRPVSTWARLDADGAPVEVGVTVAGEILTDPPPAPGPGPAGALAVVEFPREVQSVSILNHFELHWEEHGHTPPPFLVPHFDLHFYDITPAEVAAIGDTDTAAPDAANLAEGYVYGGPEAFVPQMGGHALKPADLGKPFTAVMINGYYGGKMIFVEPMVTQEELRKGGDFALDIAEPKGMGAGRWYPTRFSAHRDPAAGAWQLVLSGFERTRS